LIYKVKMVDPAVGANREVMVDPAEPAERECPVSSIAEAGAGMAGMAVTVGWEEWAVRADAGETAVS
jgi:hypothetical protein